MARTGDPERAKTGSEPAAEELAGASAEAERSKSEGSRRIDELRGGHVHQQPGRRSGQDDDVTAAVARALERIADSLATIASTLARSQGPPGPRPRPAQEFRRWPRGEQRGGGYGESPRRDDTGWPRRTGPRRPR